MRLFKLLFVSFLLVSCSQGPEFSKPSRVQTKRMHIDGKKVSAEYTLTSDNEGVRGKNNGTVIFIAPVDFADVGDTIICNDGVITTDK